MDKLTALKIFRRVVELNGFSAAATDLGLSNAAVSKNVQELEAELGAQLLNRTTRRVSLTETGKRYYDRIAVLLDSLLDADVMATDYAAQPRGRLKVNAPMSMGLLRISPIITHFLKAYPDISIELWMNDAFIDLIDQGFDIGIRGASGLDDSSLISRKLGDMPLLLCASPEFLESAPALASPKDLSHHNCLTYLLTPDPDSWEFAKGKNTININVKGSLRVNNSMALKDAAIAGTGIALMPEFICGDAIRDGRLVELLPDWKALTHAIYAVYPAHREHSQKLRVFLDFLVSRFK